MRYVITFMHIIYVKFTEFFKVIFIIPATQTSRSSCLIGACFKSI